MQTDGKPSNHNFIKNKYQKTNIMSPCTNFIDVRNSDFQRHDFTVKNYHPECGSENFITSIKLYHY